MRVILHSAWLYVQELFTDRFPYFPSNIRSSLFIMLFCMIVFAGLYLYMGIRRLRQFVRRKAEHKWKDKISNLLANIIIYGDDEEAEQIILHFLPRFQKLPLYRSFIRELLIKELLDYHANFTGKTGEVLRELYLRLKLDKQTKKKLRSRFWEVQIEGIREVTQMNLRHEASLILKFTDEENSQLRMEAQAAFVKLSSDNPFRFLDRARERILDWHQLVLFEVITKTKNVQIPSFSKWLGSRNDSVVLFCLKLVNHYQQLDALDEIVLLLKHPNPKIRGQAIKVIGKMEAEWVEDELIHIYFDQALGNRLEIIQALGRIASGSHLDFLKGRTSSDDFKIRMQAIQSIKLHGSAGRDILDDLFQKSTLQNRSIIRHVLDERIKA